MKKRQDDDANPMTQEEAMRIATRICRRMHADECMPMNEDRDRDSSEDTRRRTR